jgi:hypothetical protein
MSFKQGLVVGIVAMAVGCGVEPGDEQELGELEQADAIDEIVENLRRAGNPESDIDVRDDGTVVLGGDAVVTLEASREMIGHSGEGHDDDVELRQYRTTNLVSASVDTICINGSVATGTVSTALDNAIANYTSMNLAFDLVRTNGNAAGCDALITMVMINGTGASSGFPSGGLPYGTLNMGDDIAPYGLAPTTHVITHELGHTIGFRHTDYYNRSISCGVGGDEGDAGVGVTQIPGTPATATLNGSVMNSCYSAGSTGVWTASDITALNTLYGPLAVPVAPSPLTKVSDSCFGAYWMDWGTQANATSYQLWRSTSSGFSSPVQLYSGPSTGSDIEVTSGTWYLRARACNANGCGGWTNQVSATRVLYCN